MMPQLAVNGGAATRSEESWPGWPIHDEREEELILEVTRSGVWSFEGPKEAEFCERIVGRRFQLDRHGPLPCVAAVAVAVVVWRARGYVPARPLSLFQRPVV